MRCLPAIMMALIMIAALPIAFGGRNGEDVDIEPEIVAPWEGGRYQTEKGMYFNVTLWNRGTTWANLSGSAQLKVTNIEMSDTVYNPISRPFTGIAPGGHANISFPKWSPSKGGEFRAEVIVQYFGDTYTDNNKVQVNFSLFSETWLEDPKLEAGKVNPVFGNTSTLFTYLVKYTYNKLPGTVRVEIDGTNHTMGQVNPADTIPEDGKEYFFQTMLGVGDHTFRFWGTYTNMTFTFPENRSRMLDGPWVNITLNTPDMLPGSGYITTPYTFSVFFGSSANLPPDEIFAMVQDDRYDLTRKSLTPVYTSGKIEYTTTVPGDLLMPPPVVFTFHCSLGPDTYEIGPFQRSGPSTLLANLSGTVRDLEGGNISGAVLTLEPGGTSTSDAYGRYSFQTPEGVGFRLTCTASGYETRSYEGLEVLSGDDRNVDFVLTRPPRGSTVHGRVITSIGGIMTGLPGIGITLEGAAYSNSTLTNITGHYLLGGIPGGEDYTLSVDQHPYVTYRYTFDIQGSQDLLRDIVLEEKPITVEVTPPPGEMPIDATFHLVFAGPINISTVDLTLSTFPMEIYLDQDMTGIRAIPLEMLMYDSDYVLRLGPGLESMDGDPLVWRTITWEYRTVQQDLPQLTSDPAPDAEDLPLEPTIQFHFSTAIVESTLNVTLRPSLDPSASLPLNVTFYQDTNGTDHGRRSTTVSISCGPLQYGTSYVLQFSNSLLDMYGRTVFERPVTMEFTTMGEPDTDGDGYPDSVDDFPEDPRYHSDRDGDGYADQIDYFPDDPDEWSDTDGDGTGNNADTDDDGDGMPDAWELQHSLDPLDPADALLDEDDDGYSNYREFLDGTDPADPNSHPEEDIAPYWIWIAIAAVVLVIFIAIAFLARYRRGPKGMDEE